MSTGQFTYRGARPPYRPAGTLDPRSAAAAAASRAPVLLSGALLLVILYAAFAHGAIGSPTEARLQVAIAAIAAAAGAAWLWTGTLRLAASRVAILGSGLLVAFAVWSGATVLWSVAPDQTWIELNRALTYVIVLCLAIAIGASHERAIEMFARGFLLVALTVTAYGLGQKLLPALHVGGVFDLNQTGQLPRLQEPLGYWNALSLFIAMGVPIALALAVDASRSARSRQAALVAVELMLLAMGFTYSRGGVLTLVLALAVAVTLSGSLLRSLMWLATVCLATVPPLVFGLANHSLTATAVGLGSRQLAGIELGAVLLASLVALLWASRRLLDVEQRVEIGPDRVRGIGRLLLAAVAALVVVALLAVSFSSRGLDGTISHAWKSFTATRGTSVYDPHRLLSADSENRWVWWREAVGAFSDRPVGGWGAGAFGVVHLLYRRDTISVQQPHSVPLQFLAETGIVGALLAIGAYGLLLRAGLSSVRRRSFGPQRLLAAALFAGAVAYAVHSCYDWDWDIPAVTLPALAFLGVLAGAGRRRMDRGSTTTYGPGLRAILLGALALCLSTFALSAAIPSLASSKASSAVITAAGSSSGALDSAQSSATLATGLDPLSDAGPRAEATIAIHRGRLLQARSDLLEAIRREPTDVHSWEQLAIVELFLNDVGGVLHTATHSLALDPYGAVARTLAQRANLLAAPPNASATATPTPLPPG